MKILIVEPDEYYHNLFNEHLNFGELFLARDASGAKDFLTNTVPDAVVMELDLEDEPGYAVLRKLRDHPLVPVIVFSKVSHVQDIEASMELGANAYFVKGVDSILDVKKLLLNYA